MFLRMSTLKNSKRSEMIQREHYFYFSLTDADKGKYGMKDIFHSLDVWHGAKNLMKKLLAVSIHHKNIIHHS